MGGGPLSGPVCADTAQLQPPASLCSIRIDEEWGGAGRGGAWWDGLIDEELWLSRAIKNKAESERDSSLSYSLICVPYHVC